MITSLIVLIALILAVIFWLLGIRNRLSELRNQVQYRWSDVDLELTRRDELIRAADGYPEALVKAAQVACETATRQRQAVWQQGGPIRASLDRVIEAEEVVNALELKQLLLDPELMQTEKDLGIAISGYNQTVAHYNRRLTKAPASWLARSGGHTPASLYTVTTVSSLTPVAT